ncbi:hypothetical protein NDU88_005398 [Pleurodeles waltl]|uniref:Uncharacterized protein n=1 Tax=Pleurodeles waltl TaxID=8319 RepID=A0AAV7MXX5_PLEWA|nr:hypothetical protein NDU88_005398 [Pleurodeles waltl]
MECRKEKWSATSENHFATPQSILPRTLDDHQEWVPDSERRMFSGTLTRKKARFSDSPADTNILQNIQPDCVEKEQQVMRGVPLDIYGKPESYRWWSEYDHAYNQKQEGASK